MGMPFQKWAFVNFILQIDGVAKPNAGLWPQPKSGLLIEAGGALRLRFEAKPFLPPTSNLQPPTSPQIAEKFHSKALTRLLFEMDGLFLGQFQTANVLHRYWNLRCGVNSLPENDLRNGLTQRRGYLVLLARL
jgi:hypothetical protein